MNKFTLCLLLFLGMSASAFAQVTLKGKIVDAESLGVPGVNVVEVGTTNGTVTDIDGNFSFTTKQSTGEVEITYVGYAAKKIAFTAATTDLGTISIEEEGQLLSEVEVIASIAVDRKTPVAVSTVKGKQIEQQIGNQEFPEILRNTPSIYVTKQGGGFGDARINVRGFNQRNTAVMINGVPVNDMENGWVYWSNWAGLSDVTSQMQVQRGLGASKVVVSSVGGSINIITNAAEMKKGAAASVGVGNDGYQKYGLVLSTGLGENGWAFTLQGTRTRGDGYVDGTAFSAYSYFASLTKVINDNHSLAITALGAPQWHHQRSRASSISEYEQYGHKYNQDWGYLNGEEYSWRRNFYHKPKAFANHYWTVSDKVDIATTAYISLGRGGGTGPRGGINGNAEFRLPRTADGLYRFDDIKSWNSGSRVPDFDNTIEQSDGTEITLTDRPVWDGPDTGRGTYTGQNVASEGPNGDRYGLIRRASMNSHNWTGVISNITAKLSENITWTSGFDIRGYRGIHYRRVDDLLGNDAFFTDDGRNGVGYFVTQQQESKALVETRDDIKIDYWNDGLVQWYGIYSQLEYSNDKVSAFLTTALSNQGYQRVEYFNEDRLNDNHISDWSRHWGGSVKGGLNYNINANHNVFANAGYYSQQPLFDNVFLNFSNTIDQDIENQGILAFEAGYGYRSSWLRLNFNVYNTNWSNRTINRGVVIGGADGTVNLTGISQQHQGMELDFTVTPTRKLKLNGMLSLGNWKYTDNVSGTAFDDDQQNLGEFTLFLDGVKVGDAAQTTFSLGANYEVAKGLSLNANYYHASQLYADFDVADDDTFLTAGNQALELDSYGLVDLGVYYDFDLMGMKSTIRFNMNNVFDNIYIAESDTNITDPENFNRNRVYYGFGRTWNAGLKIRF